MALTEAQKKARDGKIGASFFPYLMAGDTGRIYNEWRWQVGDPDYVPDDLSDNWDVQFGAYVEDFVLSWHERRTGQALTCRREEAVPHPKLHYVCATLDSWRAADNCVLDCKVTKKPIEEVCSFYLPQIICQRDCKGADRGGLLIVHWAREVKEYLLEMPSEYCKKVWDRAEWFWSHVEDLTEPVEVEAIAAPVIPTKVLDMSGSNSWSIAAARWLKNVDAAKEFAKTEEEIKGLVGKDVAVARGAGIMMKRNTRGAATIMKDLPNG